MKSLATLAVIVIAGLVLWGIYLHFGVVESSSYKLFFREIEMANLINYFYLIREAISQSLIYSFYQSFYEVLSKGGFYDLSSVRTENGIPFWRYYSSSYAPDILGNIESRSLEILEEYVDEMKEKINLKEISLEIPAFKSVELKFENPSYLVLKAFFESPFKIFSKDIEIEIPEEIFSRKYFETSFYHDILSFSTYLSENIDKEDRLFSIFFQANKSVRNDPQCRHKTIYTCGWDGDASPPSYCVDEFKSKVKEGIKKWKDEIMSHTFQTLKVKVEIEDENYESSADLVSWDEIGKCCKNGEVDEESGEIKCIEDIEYKKEYEFHYKGWVKLLFSIEKSDEVSEKLGIPIFDSTSNEIKITFPKISFYVLSGNG